MYACCGQSVMSLNGPVMIMVNGEDFALPPCGGSEEIKTSRKYGALTNLDMSRKRNVKDLGTAWSHDLASAGTTKENPAEF